jgi:sRNA-binding protein
LIDLYTECQVNRGFRRYTAGYPALFGCVYADQRRVQLVKTPNFKQEKKQREMAQKKKNEQKQQQKAARKGGTPDPQPQ